jgi:hypothetical protein
MENAGLTKGFGDVGKRRKGAIICSLRSMNPDVGKNKESIPRPISISSQYINININININTYTNISININININITISKSISIQPSIQPTYSPCSAVHAVLAVLQGGATPTHAERQ